MKLCDIKPLNDGRAHAGNTILREYTPGLPNKHIDVVALDGNLGEDPLPMGIELKLSLIADAGSKVQDADALPEKLNQLSRQNQLNTITLMSDIQHMSDLIKRLLEQGGLQ